MLTHQGVMTEGLPLPEILDTVFPRIVSAETILFWKLECGNYSREETINFFIFCMHTYYYIPIVNIKKMIDNNCFITYNLGQVD